MFLDGYYVWEGVTAAQQQAVIKAATKDMYGQKEGDGR
jgi:hypothetical protein